VREDATLSSLRHTLGAGFAKNGVSLENLATVMGLTAASASRYFRQEGDHHA
jgi:predicted transcriptional regulator